MTRLEDVARGTGDPVARVELYHFAAPLPSAERGCYDIFQPDATFTGGVFQTLKIAELCRRQGLAYTPHTWTNGIGFAVNLHVFLASGFASEHPLEYPIDPPGWVPDGRDAMLVEPWLHRDGRMDEPEAPGLGFEVDHRALRRYGTRFFVMDRKRLVWFALRDRGLKAAREIDRAKQTRARSKPEG